MRINLKYCYADQDRHRNVRYYVKKPGQPKIRIREEPGSEAFMAAYHAALAGRDPASDATSNRSAPPVGRTAKRGSLRWLVEQYYHSPEWQSLSPTTQSVRRRILDRLCADKGDKPIKLLEPRHVRQMRDEMADRPEAANNFLKIMRRLYAWALEYDYVNRNPVADVRRIRVFSGGHHTWTIAEVAQYQKTHPIGTKARLALDLLLFTGVRRSDVVKLGPQMAREETREIDGKLFRQHWLYFTEIKGQTRHPKQREIPILPPLEESIRQAPSGHLTYLVTQYGKPHTANGFGNWFKKQCVAAGLPHCTAHGLRKAGASFAAENGATDRELMAIFGWETSAQATTYTRNADRRHMVRSAMHLITPETETEQRFPTEKPGSRKVGTRGTKNAAKSKVGKQ